MLTFLAPFTTAVAGALILKESFTRKELFAGSKSSVAIFRTAPIDARCQKVACLLGVVLIARPEAIFGTKPIPEGYSPEKGTPSERLGAVG